MELIVERVVFLYRFYVTMKPEAPEAYTGTRNQRTAEEWLDSIAMYARADAAHRAQTMPTDAQVIEYAGCKMKGLARTWWFRLVREHRVPETWVAFRTLVLEQFVFATAQEDGRHRLRTAY